MNEETVQQQIPTAGMDMPTPEQIAAMKLQRAAMIQSYKEELKNLEIEVKYHELQERVEKARFNTWQWRIRFDQMMAPPPEDKELEKGKQAVEGSNTVAMNPDIGKSESNSNPS